MNGIQRARGIGAFVAIVGLLATVCQLATAAPTSMMETMESTSMGQAKKPEPKLVWHTKFEDARNEAKQQKKMLLIRFHGGGDGDGGNGDGQTNFDKKVLTQAAIKKQLGDFVLLRINKDTAARFLGDEDQTSPLLSQAEFAEMNNKPGLAIVDLAHPKAKHFHKVVSAFPFQSGHNYDQKKVSVILGLPSGTITQRTLIYAVRIHPEAPQSTQGKPHTDLVEMSRWHSQYMADITLQGHHQWESRFHELLGKIPGSLEPTEVAAESWPGQPLVDAAIECVDSWRQSSGHWEGVAGNHPIYGYDMKLGDNGTWYATGIFGKR